MPQKNRFIKRQISISHIHIIYCNIFPYLAFCNLTVGHLYSWISCALLYTLIIYQSILYIYLLQHALWFLWVVFENYHHLTVWKKNLKPRKGGEQCEQTKKMARQIFLDLLNYRRKRRWWLYIYGDYSMFAKCYITKKIVKEKPSTYRVLSFSSYLNHLSIFASKISPAPLMMEIKSFVISYILHNDDHFPLNEIGWQGHVRKANYFST